jgi:hypothetical protein
VLVVVDGICIPLRCQGWGIPTGVAFALLRTRMDSGPFGRYMLRSIIIFCIGGVGWGAAMLVIGATDAGRESAARRR